MGADIPYCLTYTIIPCIINSSTAWYQPFDTRSLNIYNKSECKVAYAQMKGEVEAGIQQLLRLRKVDPYKNFLPRITYERVLRRGQQAPTAPLNLKSIYESSKSS